MPAYMVEMLEGDKKTLINMVLGKVVVWASSVADAREVAKGASDGDSAVAWDDATVTDLATVQNFSGMSFLCRVNAAPLIDVDIPMPTGNVVATVAVNAGGTGYTVNDVVTLDNGTKTRAATIRVTAESAGVVTAVELVDPGDRYTVDPTLTGESTTGGNNDLTVDVTMIANDYANLLGQMVDSLNATAITGAAMDFGAGTNGELQIASGSGGDDLGDLSVDVRMYQTGDTSKTAVPGLLGTVTHEGVSTAVLKVAMVASPVAGVTLHRL